MAHHDLGFARRARGPRVGVGELAEFICPMLATASSAFFAAGAEQPPEAFT